MATLLIRVPVYIIPQPMHVATYVTVLSLSVYTVVNVLWQAVMASNGDVTPVGCECLMNDCVAHGSSLMLTLFLSNMIVNNSLEMIVPLMKGYLKRKLEEKSDETPADYELAVRSGTMSHSEIEAKHEPYGECPTKSQLFAFTVVCAGALEAFDDLNEIFIQYGAVPLTCSSLMMYVQDL